jgi:hypothetical protein
MVFSILFKSVSSFFSGWPSHVLPKTFNNNTTNTNGQSEAHECGTRKGVIRIHCAKVALFRSLFLNTSSNTNFLHSCQFCELSSLLMFLGTLVVERGLKQRRHLECDGPGSRHIDWFFGLQPKDNFSLLPHVSCYTRSLELITFGLEHTRALRFLLQPQVSDNEKKKPPALLFSYKTHTTHPNTAPHSTNTNMNQQTNKTSNTRTQH